MGAVGSRPFVPGRRPRRCIRASDRTDTARALGGPALNAIAAIGGPDILRVAAAYRALVPCEVWRLGLSAARDPKDPLMRSLDALIEPFLRTYYEHQARQKVAGIAASVAAWTAGDSGFEATALVDAANATLGRDLPATLMLIAMLDRAHALEPLSFVIGDDATPLARAALAWARARDVRAITVPPHLPLRKPPQPTGETIVVGTRARSIYESFAAAVPVRALDAPEASLAVDRGMRRSGVRDAMVRTLGWNATDLVVVFEPATPERASASDPPDPFGLSLAAMFGAFAFARAKVPTLRLAVIAPPLADGFARAESAAREAGVATSEFAYSQTDHDTWTAGADIVVSVDSARSAVAALAGIAAINLWWPTSWQRGPVFGAQDCIVEASAQALGPTIVALAGDAAVRDRLATIARQRVAAGGAWNPRAAAALADALRGCAGAPTARTGRAALDVLIVAPSYVHWSAGQRSLHRLCHLINLCGARATVYPAVDFHPTWNTPRRIAPVTPQTIVIHPESTERIFDRGNFVRWVLNAPGLLGGPKTYGPEEMVFYFSEAFRAAAQAATAEPLSQERLLRVSTTEPELFYNDRSIVRTYDCVYVGKNRALYERVQPRGMRDAIAIERLASAWPAQRHETAALLRGCRRFFSFDPYTAMVDEALMCGAEVHFIREDGSVEKYFADPDEMYRENVRLYYDTASVSAFLGLLEARWG